MTIYNMNISYFFVILTFFLTTNHHASGIQKITMEDEEEKYLAEGATIFWSNPNHALLDKVYHLIYDRNPSVEMIKLFLKQKADPNTFCTCYFPNHSRCSCNNITPLNYMCDKDNPSLEVIQVLLEYGANPNNKPRLGKQPLLSMCYKANPSVACVKHLLEYKADPNIKTYMNNTLLHRMCIHTSPSLEIIKLLINAHIHQ